MSTGNIVILFSAMSLLGGCVTVKAPKGTVPQRAELVSDAFGGWIAVVTDSSKAATEGELIAVGEGEVYVLSKDTLQTISKTEIQSARLIFYNNQSDGFARLTVAASLVSLTNGYYFILSLPIVLITGITTTLREAKRISYLDFPGKAWPEIQQYSRFPQGLPADIDLAAIRPRETKSGKATTR